MTWVCASSLFAQDDCENDFIRIFGSLIENEKGYSLSSSLDQKSVYVGGIKGDSAVLLNVSTSGQVLWTRSFDVVPGKPDHIYRVLTDTEGMIGVSGIAGSQQSGGNVFVLRYDPLLNKVLWAKELIISGANFNLGMIELGPGGNYLVTNNPVSPNVAELVELDKSNGQVITSFSKRYDLGSSETIYDLAYYNGQLYGAGRFSDGGSVAEMRNTLLRLDPTNGSVGWMKLGHRTASQTARFYGLDLVVSQNDLFSAYLGDDGGTSVDNTKIYLQRTGLDGTLKWIKQYELPGTNDWADEIIDSDGGIVVLARNRVAPSDLILFKTDYNGTVLWGKRFDYAFNDNAVSLGSIQSQLIEVDGHFYFTAFAEENGNSDLIIARTNLNGEISDTCASTFDVNIPVMNVTTPDFYSKTPIITNAVPQQKSLSVDPGIATTLQGKTICSNESATQSNLDIAICSGDMYEGYSQQGIYIDTFISQNGCDSIRILTLSVTILESFVDMQICAGGQFEGYTVEGNYIDTLHAIAGGCDTLRHLSITFSPPILITIDRSICTGNSIEGYEVSGMYIDTFTTPEGCDSIRVLNLEVTDVLETFMDVEICPGQQYQVYTQPGIYIDTFSSIFGCDSIRTLELSVDLPAITTQVEICAGAQFDGYAQQGMYVDTLPTAPGICDTVRFLTLTVTPPIQESLMQTICQGEMYQGYTTAGIYIDTISTTDGCDSIRTLILDVAEQMQSVLEPQICQGQQYEGYSHSGVYLDTFATIFGCDSIRTIHLEVTPPNESFIELSFCEGYKLGYTVSGTYVDTLSTDDGCDSIRTVLLEEHAIYIPNVFSPNNDGQNDLFEIIVYSVETLDLDYFAIYDRYGNMALETHTWPIQWNGTGKEGMVYNPGVYTYVLTFICQNEKQVLTGDITLIR